MEKTGLWREINLCYGVSNFLNGNRKDSPMNKKKYEDTKNPFKWKHWQAEIILWLVRWYCRYALSYTRL